MTVRRGVSHVEIAAASVPVRPGKSALTASAGFGAWLTEQKGFLALSTMGSGHLFVLTGDGQGGLAGGARNLGLTRGLSVDCEHLYVANNTRIVHLVNRGAHSAGAIEFDANYVPHSIRFVGDGLLHDVQHCVKLLGEIHDVVFVNTNYSTIATFDEKHSFRPLWTPSHISRLVPEDRCHLNCIGTRDGEIAYALMFGLTDSAEGWRVADPGSGVVIDIGSGEVICRGLSKPHSLKWHQDRLWLLNSEMGEFGYVDPAQSRFVPVAHLGNFLRGLTMIGDCAVIGATTMRGRPFRNEAVIDGLTNTTADGQMSAIYVLDLRTGEVVYAALLSGIEAIYDIAFVSGLAHPLIAKFNEGEEIRQWTTFDPAIPLEPGRRRV